MFAVITCIGFMAFVAWYSWYKTKGTIDSADGYFLAGNGLSSVFIAGSLLLTNISTEQLIGQNGIVYFGNLTALAWEVWAVRGIILLACLFLPMYLGGAFATMPAFLRSRYGEGTRRLVVGLLMFGYIFVWSPTILYGGSLALMKLLDIRAMTGLSQVEALWLVTWVVGIIGAVYAITGGLRAVAISDTLNGVALLVVGCLIPIYGLIALGDKLDGGISDALYHMATTHTEKLNAIGGSSDVDVIPFSAIFTGLMVTATFYWGTNQFVIQRALGAASLKEGQRGLLMAGFFKMLVPFMAMLPGLIAFHLFGPGLEPRDLAYPELVAKTLPAPLLGLFVAVLLGAVFSTYNSLLNSAATMFALDIYKPFVNPDADDSRLIYVSKVFAIICAIAALFAAPALLYAPEGLFVFLQQFTGFIAVPIVTLVMMGLFAKRLAIPPRAAQFIIVFHVITYYLMVWGLEQTLGIKMPIHWMHVFALLFVVEVAILVIWALVKPCKNTFTHVHAPKVAMVPWRYAMLTSSILLTIAVMMYVVFSNVGLAYADGVVSPQFWTYFLSIGGLCAAVCFWSHTKLQPAYERYTLKHFGSEADKQAYAQQQEQNTSFTPVKAN
ncbi:solute:sodium symporter family transporter [Endozoicomonas elysicola]|uniref:Sodium transporter n=1 Tax=Endozoicomonas elysicola TaxID=305900 RepID=A0A081K7I5_9GAMM|nr:solute:sodium symporter family transporter [Endozoicomonas elysicola]KEI70111.1 sodium transporter [Endozoicomonas elysicola]